MGIPFVAFDAGGVLEMYSGKLHPDNVVLEPTLQALQAKLNKASPQAPASGPGSHYFSCMYDATDSL